MSVFKKYISNNEEETNQKPSSPTPASSTSSTPAPNNKPVANESSANKSAPSSKVAATNGRNVLSSDVEIKGKVKFTNDLVVDGLIEGEIVSDGSLTVGENARIKAEVNTRSVVIYGKVHGNINVTDRVELKANAELVGDIKAATLSIEAGAIFVGKSTVGAPSAQAISASASTKKTESKPKNGKLATA